jgi:D-glycero-D-manno-heptose 1,7-bisphosphate phosphatase
MNKCVFLDRDGVLNEERGDYTYKVSDFKIIEGVQESLKKLKSSGFLLIVITNQGGICREIYTKKDMLECHKYLMDETSNIIDDIYYSPYHPNVTESISRKPDSLMFERAIAKYNVDVKKSWMVGDSDRDIESAHKLGIRAIRVNKPWEDSDKNLNNLAEATELITNS